MNSNQYLKHLYINKTQVETEDIKILNNHPSLEKVFAFDTPISEAEISEKFNFYLEIGKYTLPALPTDTIEY
jgi:hypothetical protein